MIKKLVTNHPSFLTASHLTKQNQHDNGKTDSMRLHNRAKKLDDTSVATSILYKQSIEFGKNTTTTHYCCWTPPKSCFRHILTVSSSPKLRPASFLKTLKHNNSKALFCFDDHVMWKCGARSAWWKTWPPPAHCCRSNTGWVTARSVRAHQLGCQLRFDWQSAGRWGDEVLDGSFLEGSGIQ